MSAGVMRKNDRGHTRIGLLLHEGCQFITQFFELLWIEPAHESFSPARRYTLGWA